MSVPDRNIEARKRRWSDFYAMDGKKRFMSIVDFEGDIPARPPLWPGRKRERVDWMVRKYECLHERARWLDDDMVPHIDMTTGTEIFAEAFGCKVVRPDDDMPFARPLVHSATEAAKVRVPDPDGSTLSLLFEMAEAARDRAGKDAVMKLPDIQSPMDIAALIWDKNDFFAALHETPEAVKELAEKVFSLMTAFLDRWFARFGRDFVAHFPFYYMTSGVTLSEDEVGSVGPAAFREFFLPELAGLSERYGGLGVHCCANARHQWDNFRRLPGLQLLNLCQPGEVLNEAVAYFAGRAAQQHMETPASLRYFGGRPAWEWPEAAPEGVHMVLTAAAGTRAEAMEICRRLNRARGR